MNQLVSFPAVFIQEYTNSEAAPESRVRERFSSAVSQAGATYRLIC
jgi:hypothetical protein